MRGRSTELLNICEEEEQNFCRTFNTSIETQKAQKCKCLSTSHLLLNLVTADNWSSQQPADPLERRSNKLQILRRRGFASQPVRRTYNVQHVLQMSGSKRPQQQ